MKFSMKLLLECLLCFAFSFLMAINYEVFVYENSFAPAGINGIAVMIQHKLHFRIEYMSLIINLPLLIASFIVVDKYFSIKSLIYILGFSLFTYLFTNGNTDVTGFISLQNYVYKTEYTSKILAPVASGVISGLIYGYSFRVNSSTGGTDIIAKLMRVRHPELSLVWIIFALNSVVAISSCFVYANEGFNIEPVIMCIIYCFISSEMSDIILKGNKTALKFEVVTSHAEEIAQEIIAKLNHSATVTHAQGMFSHSDKNLLICVVSKNQIVEFEKILKAYPDTFAYVSSVNEVVGKFVFSKSGIKKH